MYRDLTGERFGRLVVLRRGPDYVKGRAQWICKCDCRNKTLVRTDLLNGGLTRSCGCLKFEIRSTLLSRYLYAHKKGPFAKRTKGSRPVFWPRVNKKR